MAKKQRKAAASPKPVTADRARRLYRLLTLLRAGSQTRETLTRRLKLDIRGFYRDLELLREFGISLDLHQRRYSLTENLKDALQRLPFPDPRLTLGEAQQLAKGRSAAHRKLRQQIDAIVG